MEPDPLADIVRRALAEDTGGRDVTTDAVVPAGATARARIVQKQPGVLSGFAVAEEVFRQCGVSGLEWVSPEGEWISEAPSPVVEVAGIAASLLAAERTVLNFLGHLSGVATLTARYVEAVAGT